MIDFHTHILPGIDDGSQNISMTKSMIYLEKVQGIDRIIATPHFYAYEASVDWFISHRDHALEKVRQRVYEPEEAELPVILPGAEVYYFPGMGRADLSSLCIGGTDLLLVEMPFSQWTKSIYEDLERIVRRQRLTVVLVHVERYYQFQKNKDIWKRVFELPVIVQFNAGSLMSFTRRRLIMRFIQSGYPVVLGSDCHNTTDRPPNLEEGRRVLRKKLGDDVLKDIDQLGERLLRDHAIT